MAKIVCAVLIVLILLALVYLVPENLNQRYRGEEPTFSMGEITGLVIGGIVLMGILAVIATGGHREENG